MIPRIILSWSRRGPPAFIGGAEQATWRLLKRMADRGVEIHVVGRSRWPWQSGGQGAVARSYLWSDIRCHEAASEEERLAFTLKLCGAGQRTFLLSALEGSAETFLRCAGLDMVTAVHWVHSAEQVVGKARFQGIELYASPYLAERGCATRDDVLRPLAGHSKCSVRRGRALRSGLFVNPVPEKGFATLVAIAEARPDLRFIVRMGWYDELSHAALPQNIIVKRRSEGDECIYSKVDFALMPSKVAEGYGLVAAEALIHGVPCLGSRVGGLPEILPSEFIMDSDVPFHWCAALDRIAEDFSESGRLAVRAGAEIRRREEESLEQFRVRLELP